ncbi:MAG: hypothetical protein ACYS0K_17615 [Planctomycetota bacterium]|jgi:hypothetical protein
MEISRQSQINKEIAQQLDGQVWALVFTRRCDQLWSARRLREAERYRHYLRSGCRSLAEYGEKVGYSREEAVMLAAVGRALELRPALRKEILTGKVMLEEAAALGRAADGASGTGNAREREPPPGYP